MTFNSIDEIKSLIENPINQDMLKCADLIRRKHELHVSGIGLDKYLDKIQGIENDNAVSLRRALAKPITQPETGKIISVFNKIFSARGGGRYYEFSNERDEQTFKTKILNDVKNGYSIKEYMQKVWKELVNVDPNGIILAEIDNEQTVFFSYKSSESILDIAFKGPNKIEYIIFKPETDKKTGAKFYRVIDDRFDYTVKQLNKQFEIIPEQSYQNYWGFVPGTFISERLDKKSNGFDSHISECMIHADDLLLDYTIYKVYKTRIAIPLHWQYQRQCTVCNGSGKVFHNDNYESCSKCGGKGYDNHNRDVSEIIVLPIPENGDVPLTPPAGYVQPDLSTWEKQENTINNLAEQMYLSVWGELSYTNKERSNITASEVIIRENSKESKLNDISDNEENVEKRLTDILALYYFPSTYNGCIINNGRHFEIKPADTLLKEYTEALKNNVPSIELTNILSDYYHSMYRKSPKKLNEMLIKLNAKPFFHYSPEKIINWNINEIDYLKHLYFDEFVVYFEQNIESLGVTTLEKVQSELDKWIKTKDTKEDIETIDNQNLE